MNSKIYNRRKRDRLKSVFRGTRKSVKFSIFKNLSISIISIALAVFLIIYLNNFPKSYLELSNITSAYNDIIMGLSFLVKGFLSLGAALFIIVLQFISLALIVISLFRLLRVLSYIQRNKNKKRIL